MKLFGDEGKTQTTTDIDSGLNDYFANSIAKYGPSALSKRSISEMEGDGSDGDGDDLIAEYMEQEEISEADLDSNDNVEGDSECEDEKSSVAAAIVDDEKETKKSLAGISESGSNLESVDESEKLKRTIFVGNVPKTVTEKAGLKRFKALFSTIGPLESIRFRSVAFNKPLKGSKSRRMEFIKGNLHQERDSLNGYIVFKKQEDAREALKLNATVFDDHHLRVDLCAITTPPSKSGADPSATSAADASVARKNELKRSVFVGNLPFTANEEQLWRLFGDCGQIENVRLIRDKATNVGKGFAYVLFKERSSVSLALDLNGTLQCAGRNLRIQKCLQSAQGSTEREKRNENSYQGTKATAKPTGAKLRLMRKQKVVSGKKKTSPSAGKQRTRKPIKR